MQPPDVQGVTWLRLPAAEESIEQFSAFILGHAKTAGMSQERFPILELALEELLVNVVSYAYDGEPGWIRVGCGTLQGRFLLWIEDQGKPFNPLARAEPDVNEGIDERRVGGLGIHLVKSMTDGLTYSRHGNSNLLEVQFKS